MEKTISFLNSKIWYRVIKVVCILSLVFVLFAFNGIVVGEVGIKKLDTNKTSIICDKGNKNFTPKQLSIELSDSYFKDGFNYKKYFEKDYGYNDDVKTILENCYGKEKFEKITDDIYDYQKLFEILKSHGLSSGAVNTENIKPVTDEYNAYKILVELQPMTEKTFYLDYSVQLFDIDPAYTYITFIKYLIIGNLIILLVFEIMRRGFYYIVLGKLFPSKR